MKKSYLMLVASAAIFAACSETEKIQENLQDYEPTAIGFTSYSQKATRGNTDVATNLEYYHNKFAVYGTKQNVNDATDIQYVFGGKATAVGVQDGVTCTYQTSADAVLGDWKYDDPRFWDKQATYDFIAYAPAATANPIRYYYGAVKAQVGDAGSYFKTSSDYILTGTNIQATATQAEKVKGFNEAGNADLDLMISDSEAQNGNGHDTYVNLVFRHILSKLNITIGQAEALYNSEVTIKEVKVTGLKDKGSYNEQNYNATANPKVSGWTAGVDNNTYALLYTGNQVLDKGQYVADVFQAGDPYFFIESLVMPQTIVDDQTTLTIKYKIASGSYNEDYTYTLDLYDLAALQKYYDGYNYYLNITIAPDVIKFDATATLWDNTTVVNQTVQ